MSLLEIKDISISFAGLKAIDTLSLRVEEGEIHGIIGPNGAGKTTLFNCITGVYKPQSGNILWQGVSICGQKPHKIARAGIARTFQTIRLFKQMSVAENIICGADMNSNQKWYHGIIPTPFLKRDNEKLWKKVEEILEFFKLSHYAQTPAGELPYGIQRRVEIARALACEPKLLILDEPCAGLNENETLELGELIKTIRSWGVTVLIIEHHMELMMSLAERLSVINFGAMIAEGTPSEIQNNQAVLEAYIGVVDE